MQVTTRIASQELREIIIKQIGEQVGKHLKESKDIISKQQVEAYTKELRLNGWFKQEARSNISRIIHKKVNEDYGEVINEMIQNLVDRQLSKLNINSGMLQGLVDKEVKRRLTEMLKM